MFGQVVTTEAHLAYDGTAELSSIIEAPSFLGPAGPVTRGSQACLVHDSKHAANICLGMIQTRTKVPLGLTSQQLLLQAQLRQRITMQDIYNHGPNVGMNVPTTLLLSEYWSQFRTRTLQFVGFTFLLSLLPVLVATWPQFCVFFTQGETGRTRLCHGFRPQVSEVFFPCFPKDSCDPLVRASRFCCVFGSVDVHVLLSLSPLFLEGLG